MQPIWQYDESRQIGTDYESEAEVEAYDRRMQKMRNIEAENKKILSLLDLKPNQTVLEIGTGTGEFALTAAQKCLRVEAIDVSESMLKYAEKKAAARGTRNVHFSRAGFLTYDHQSEPFDAIVTQKALHHIPDFWKQIALLRIAGMLKPKGLLFLDDIIYSFDPQNYERFFESYIEGVAKSRRDNPAYTASHIKNEYSTLGWIMEGMIKRAGFTINRADYRDGFIASYLCAKI